MASHPFYATKKWKAKHNVVMRCAEYKCQECKRYGRTVPAAQVHHIIPLAWCLTFNKPLAFMNINLIALCTSCHNKMHDRENDTLTAAGLELVDRRYGDDKPKGWEA